jgi:glutathione S-transferase
MARIILYQLAPSFNSRKVRYSLGVKGVSYETVEVGDANIEEVIAVSGQPLTPVLKHNNVVMFDSGAIVRYIDANIPGPRLFSENADEMRMIESWEGRSRAEILNPYLQMSGEVKSGRLDAGVLDVAREKFFQGAANVESGLNEHGVLVSGQITAADIFCGCYLAYGFLTEQEAGSRPPMVWAKENIALADSMPKLSTWFERLRSFELNNN